ncbi:DUF5134 domain-containing protein [Streptomyces paludis]|uniref:DUF5134 domain-containing protein n=1 Tax=Streptomyces paludis TaxID=2282738 RepID=A0A345HIM3_9ACTN|nr:DUF5134 domain-containing protein [Streptomyces paludis]AXG76547.1 DUF5134 domain-containing protein [Streptomyces paludis]
MHGPATAGWLLVALCAAAGGFCLLRLRGGAPEQRRSAGGEALMGFGMAAMAVPAAVLTPPRWVWAGYAVVFGAAALHVLMPARGGERANAPRTDRSSRHRHRSHHLLGMLAMVYMAGVMAAAPGGAHGAHAGAGVGGTPLVTGVLLVYFAGYVLWSGTRLLPVAATDPAPPGQAVAVAGWGGRPELVSACRLSMGLAMLAMLMTL